MDEFVILVAVQVRGNNRAEAMENVMEVLPKVDMAVHPNLECWWIAEDDRTDGSDCDSAVFVRPGAQHAASNLLNSTWVTLKDGETRINLTADCNLVPDRDENIWHEATEI